MTNITLMGVGSNFPAGVTDNGYFSGGFTGANVDKTDKLNFSSDTTTMTTKGALSGTRREGTGGGYNSATIGYVSGGFTTARVTTTDGLTFSTDTTTMVTKGALTAATNDTGSANSSTLGYTAGFNDGTNTLTTDNGLTFSTDTTAQVTKGALVTARARDGGTNSGTIGYWTGGDTGAFGSGNKTTTTNGLTFSTDTTAMVTKGALALARSYMSSYNSSTIGYWSGGLTNTTDNSSTTTTNGLTFSTDTTLMVTKGALATARDQMAAANSSTFGYSAGGDTNGDGTALDKNEALQFSSDTTGQVTKGALSAATRLLVGGFQGGSGTQLV